MKETFRASSDVIACTLRPAELRDAKAAWQKLLRLSLVSRELIPGGLRLRMHPGSVAALRELVDIERECCRWITFELDGASLTMTASGAGTFAIRRMWRQSK
jgi:hypothetical protein